MASLGSIKVQHILWDSDKDPFGFNQWLSEFSDMVRALKGGEVLELFLDEKLKCLMRHASMVSKILLDDGSAFLQPWWNQMVWRPPGGLNLEWETLKDPRYQFRLTPNTIKALRSTSR